MSTQVRTGWVTGKMPTLKELVDSYERMIVVKTLVQNDYDRSKTAEALGVPRTTLWNLIKKHGIGDPEIENEDVIEASELAGRGSGAIVRKEADSGGEPESVKNPESAGEVASQVPNSTVGSTIDPSGDDGDRRG